MKALILVPIVFIIFGIVTIVWPKLFRDHEQGWFTLIKDEHDYVVSSRLFGLIFLILGLAFLVLFVAGALK